MRGAEMMEGWEGCGEKEKKTRKCVDFSPTDVTNISPHRMYDLHVLGNICFFLTLF
jgi:hypothetical protein